MEIEYQDFIGIYNNVFPEGYCEHIIREMDRAHELDLTYDRWKSEKTKSIKKNDIQLNGRTGVIAPFNDQNSDAIFFEGLQTCFADYTLKYSSLTDVNVNATVMKIQKTFPGGGYHIWHAEQGNNESATRSLVYMLYLNSLTPAEAGETEFLYQQKRFSPVKNTMILWPASFTHTHRGNVVFGNQAKYIITGWFYNT